MSDLITYKQISAETITTLLGTAPCNEEIYREYILSKAPEPEDTSNLELQSKPDLHIVDPNSEFDKSITAFHRHPEGDALILYDYHLLGFLKASGNTLKDSLSPSIKNLRAKIVNFITIFPRYILLADQPDGIHQRPLRVLTSQGPRSVLAASEYLSAPINFNFYIGLIKNKEVTWDVIFKLLKYAEVRAGLLQNRNSGYGRFKITSIKDVDPETHELPDF